MAKNNSKIIAKVPNLRFPSFEGEWEEKKLGEICKMQAGKFISASEIDEKFNDYLLPCYGGNGLRGYTKTYNYDGKYSLIGRQGALCGNINLANGKFYATEHAVVVTSSNDVDVDMMYYLLSYLNLNQYATGAAQPGLSVQNIEKVKTTIPTSKLEQNKISSFLSLLDERIQTQSKIIEELKLLKRTVKEKIFSRRLRFQDDEFSEWKNMQLSNIGKFYAGGDLTKLEYKKEKSEKYIYPVYANGSGSGLYGYATSFQYPENCVTVSGRGNLGFANARFEKFNAIVRLIVIIPNTDINPKYLEEAINNMKFSIESTGVPQLTVPQISKYSCLIPSLKEQIKIADCLSAIDKKIEIENNVLEQYERQKKYLLQNLFI
ncbi:MAG: restriction endonuclease subunit S [Sphingobacteriales bacterium JAD_PAG50586_3]|nr:MAG: restriction endonuclease subunit S [Sphingobacteriales bacterium JAD_PAG50586_3]